MKVRGSLFLLLAVLTPHFGLAQTDTVCLDKAQALFDKARYGEALTAFKTCTYDSSDVDATLLHGRILVLLEKYDTAMVIYRNLAAELPSDVRVFNSIGALYYMSEVFDSSLHYYNRVIDLDPEYEFGHYNRGLLYLETGELEKALVDCRIYLGRFPEDSDGHRLYGDYYAAIGEYDSAIVRYEMAIGFDDKIPENFESLGDVYYLMDELHYRDAIQQYRKADKLRPEAWNSYMIGLCYDYLGENKDAITYYDKAIAMDNTEAQFYTDKADLCWRLENYTEGMKTIEWAIELAPDDPLNYYIRGNLYLDKESYSRAMKDLRHAVSLDSLYAEAWASLGYTSSKTDEPEQALEFYSKAIAIDSLYLMAYYNRAGLRDNARDFDGAIADYNIVLQLDPEDADAYYFRAKTYEKMGDFENACKDMRAAARLGDKFAKDEVDYYCNKLNK